MMMSEMPFKDMVKIHLINGYNKDPKAQEAFNRVSNEVMGASWANVFNAPSFDDYADAVCAIDDEPFMIN